MIVVVILTAIVVGLAFSVLRLVQNHMNGIRKNYFQKTEFHKLEQALWLDFNRYPNLKYNTSGDKLILSNEIDSTFYTFHKNFIVSELDTFDIPIQNKSFFFLGDEVPQGNIDALKITASKAFQNQSVFIYHKSDATAYMKHPWTILIDTQEYDYGCSVWPLKP